MKKVWLVLTFGILTSFCLQPAFSAGSKWTYVVSDSRRLKYHFNNNTIQKQGDNVIYEQMIIFPVPQNGMTGGTSQFKGSCKSRVVTQDKQAVIFKGQVKPLKMTTKGGKMLLPEKSELGKVLTAVCKSKKK